MTVNTRTSATTARNTMFWLRRDRGNQTPAARRGTAVEPRPRGQHDEQQARQDDAADERAIQREWADVDGGVGDDLLQPQECTREPWPDSA